MAGSLCRYITRPALSDERIQVNAAGQVQLELKTPWQDGTTHLVLSPLEFMQRLAALVPRPRLLVSRDRSYRHARPPAFGNDLGLERLAVSSPAVPAVTQIRLRSVHVSI